MSESAEHVIAGHKTEPVKWEEPTAPRDTRCSGLCEYESGTIVGKSCNLRCGREEGHDDNIRVHVHVCSTCLYERPWLVAKPGELESIGFNTPQQDAEAGSVEATQTIPPQDILCPECGRPGTDAECATCHQCFCWRCLSTCGRCNEHDCTRCEGMHDSNSEAG